MSSGCCYTGNVGQNWLCLVLELMMEAIWNCYSGNSVSLLLIADCLDDFARAIPAWHLLLDACFLSGPQKKLYVELLRARYAAISG